MPYEVKEVSERNGLQTRARVLETPSGRFVVLQTYEQLQDEWMPIHVFSPSGSVEYKTVAGRLYKENEGDGFFVTPIEHQEIGTKEYVRGLLRASGHEGGVSFW